MKTAIRLLLAIFTLLLMINATSADVEFVEIDWNELETSITPEGRFDGGMAYMDATDQILLFGGMSLEGPVSESAIYNVGEETWNFLEIDGPSARYGHSMVYEPKSGYVLLFGGSDGTTIFGDTWQFDPKTLSWSEIMADEGLVSVNGDMTVDDQGKVYYFGGDNGDSLSNDLLVFDLHADNPEWEVVSSVGASPSGRLDLSLQYLFESNQILIFGGITSDGGLDDTWIFDLNTFEWSEIEEAGVPNSFEYYNWAADVSSGYDSETEKTYFVSDYNVWSFDTEDQKWSAIDQQGRGVVETLRTGNQFVYVPSLSSFVQFGGADMMMGISDEMSFLSIKVSSGAELDNQVSSEDKTVSQYVEKEISEVAEGPLSFINLVTGFVIYGILRIRRDEITLSNN